MNEVKITGRVYNAKTTNTLSGKSITRFGLSIYCGKDKEGKAKYGFVDCKYFGNLVTDEKLKDVTGHLTVDSWEKDGKKFSKPEIIVDTIVTSEMFSNREGPKKDRNESEIDDSIDDIDFGG